MAASASLGPDIEEALGRGSPARRAVTLERVTTLFLAGAERFSEDQVSIFDDVIGRLIVEIETRALAELSHRLAPVGNAPVKVVRRLAQHDDIAIAGPVLRQSERLSDDDLVAVARSKGQAHLMAIAHRPAIERAVTDVLVRRGDRDVALSVAGNLGAMLSEAAFTALVHRSGQDGVLAERVGARDDIPPHLFRRLVMQAAAIVQTRLLAKATPQTQAEIRGVLAKVIEEVGAERPRDYRDAQARVGTLARSGALNEAQLVAFAKAKDFEATVVALAALCRVPIDVVDRLISGGKPDPVLVLCKAMQYEWSTPAAVLSLWLRGGPALDNASDQFRRMSIETAQRVLHFWRAQPAGGGAPSAAPLRS
jgi:uncharacterized protein (DUF2336 family)